MNSIRVRVGEDAKMQDLSGKYLKKICSGAERISKTRPFEAGSIREISNWLNRNGEVMSRQKDGTMVKRKYQS